MRAASGGDPADLLRVAGLQADRRRRTAEGVTSGRQCALNAGPTSVVTSHSGP